MERSELGKLGEDLACEYLVCNGYRIIERNYRQPYGEIDIISRAPDKTLVFVEVKTMIGVRRETQISPEDQLSASKLRKFKKTASLYSGARTDLIHPKRGWRIDAITILIPSLRPTSTLTTLLKDCVINHYDNV